MSQQQPQQAQSPYPTWPQTQQTHQSQQPNDNLFPPAKRQRLSPSPSSPAVSAPPLPYANSPYATSSPYQNINLPNNFSRPQPLGGSPITSNTMPPPNILPRIAQTSNIMGPPQRPMERGSARQPQAPQKEKDHFEIGDMMDMAAGYDIEAEERELASNSWRNTVPSAQAPNGTQKSFNLLQQQSFGGHRTTAPHISPEEVEDRKHRLAARAVAEGQQHHLENPFLWGNGMRRRIERVAGEIGVLVPLDGLFDRVNHNPLTNPTAPSVLNRNSPLEPMLSLLSLASNERIRGLLEDSYGLARGRQIGTDGVVPPEWTDLAVGDGAKSTTVEPKSITGSAWEKGQDGVTRSEGALPPTTDATFSKPVPQPTLAFNRANSITATLAALSRQDRQAEETRMKIRAARKAKKAAQAAAAALSAPGSVAGDGATTVEGAAPVGMLGEKAPEVKMSKKAREALEKSARADMSEEIQTRSANQTASMQLGGRQYSWMSKGKGAAPVRAVPGRVGTPGTTTAAKVTGPVDPLAAIKDRKYGQWREDGIGGRGVQLRDWIGVLEQDGREKKTLIRAYTRQGTENVDGTTSTIMTAEAAAQAPNNIYTQTPTQNQAMSQEQNNIYGSRPGTANGTPVSATANFSTPWTAPAPAPRPTNTYASSTSSPHPTPGIADSAQNMSLQLPGQQRQGQAVGQVQSQNQNAGQSPATTSSQPGSAPMSRGPSSGQQQQQVQTQQHYPTGTPNGAAQSQSQPMSQTQSSQGVTPAPPTQNGVAVS